MCELKRICKICNEEKELTNSNFQYHSGEGYFSRTCLKCINLKRRDKNSIFIDNKFVPYKICSRCSEKKLRTEENYSYINKKGGWRKYKIMCKVCEEEFKKTVGRKRTEIVDDGSTKQCNICGEDKSITDFYPSGTGYSSYCCVSCERDRKRKQAEDRTPEEKEQYSKKRKESYLRNLHHSLCRSYREFDFSRKYDNNVDSGYIKESLSKPCSYCGFPSTGLDRIENSIGHTIENCVPCCSECNSARMDNFTYKEMIQFIGPAIKEAKQSRIDSEKFLEAVKLILN